MAKCAYNRRKLRRTNNSIYRYVTEHNGKPVYLYFVGSDLMAILMYLWITGIYTDKVKCKIVEVTKEYVGRHKHLKYHHINKMELGQLIKHGTGSEATWHSTTYVTVMSPPNSGGYFY